MTSLKPDCHPTPKPLGPESFGPIVDVSRPCTAPEPSVLHGKYVDLVPLQAEHTADLWPLLEGPQNAVVWKFWPDGPFPDEKAYIEYMSPLYGKTDPLFWAIIEPNSGKCQGHVIVGHISVKDRAIEAGMFLSTALQRTTAATEAFYLVASLSFDLGFRRLSWETASVNMGSRNAAERFGFKFEGIFRQDKIQKGRSRDTVWYSIIDKEWPVRKLAFEKWLHPDNFDTAGRQKESLSSIRNQLEVDANQ